MGLAIADGYTLEGFLPRRPGLHEEVRFKYRPALPGRVADYMRADKASGVKEMAQTARGRRQPGS